MGFGYVLIGYIVTFLFSLSNVYFFADIIGAVLMMIGLSRLSSYGKNFYRAMQVDIVFLILCFTRALLMMLRVITGEGVLATALTVGIVAVGLVLQFFLFAGIHFLSAEVGLVKEPINAKRSLFLIFTYSVLHILVLVIGPSLSITVGNILALCVFLYGLVAMLFNIFLIHSCYCRICPVGQEHGQRTKSKYEWVNRLNEKADSVMDNAFAHPKKTEPETEAEPGYRRVKRKKNSKHK